MKKRFCNVSRKVMAIVMATALVVPTIALNPMEAKAVVYENPEALDCTSWWTNFTGGYQVDTAGMNLSFDYKANEGATLNYEAPALLVYSSDNGKMDGANYECYAIIRADVYAVAQGNWSYGSNTETWTNLGYKKTDFWTPVANDNTTEGAYKWSDWVADNITGQEADVAARKNGNYVNIAYNVGGVKSVYEIPVSADKDIYICVTGQNCKLSNFVSTEYTGDVIECAAFWGTKTFGYSVDDDGLNLTMKSKTNSEAVGNHNTPILIVYNGTEAIVNGNGYSEIGVIRSDNYGWGGTGGTSFTTAGINVPANAAEWAAWLAENKQNYVDCEVNADIDGNILTIEFENNGVISKSTVKIDPTKEVYISVSGEQCKIKDIKEVDTNTEIVNLLGAQIQTIEDSDSYNLGFVTTISKENFNNLNIKEMGVLLKNSANATSLAMVTGNDGDVIKKITTNYVAPIELLDDTQKNSDTYAFRTIVKGVSNLYKKYTAVPYVTYMDGEEEVTVYGDAITRTVHDGK